MIRRYVAVAAATVACFLPAQAEAQRANSAEFGILAQYTTYDADVGLDNTAAIGLRGGIFLLDDLAVELQLSHGEPGISSGVNPGDRSWITHQLFQLRVVYAHRLGTAVDLLLGGGFAYDNYYRTRQVAGRGAGPAGLLGFRYTFTDRLSVRAEGTGYYVSEDPTRDVPRSQALNLGIQAGVSLSFGNREDRIVELPPPPPDTVIVVAEVEPSPPEGDPVEICLATGQAATIHLTPQGDTLVGYRRIPLADLGPAVSFAGSYAAERDWFTADDPVTFTDFVNGTTRTRTFRRTGESLSLDCREIMRVGEFSGVPLFTEAVAQRPYYTLYVPVRPGVWQAYR